MDQNGEVQVWADRIAAGSLVVGRLRGLRSISLSLGGAALLFAVIGLIVYPRNDRKVGTKMMTREIRFRVHGTSMEPLLPDNSYIEVRSIGDDPLQWGDIVVLTPPGTSRKIVKQIRAVPGDLIEVEKVKNFYFFTRNQDPIRNSQGEIIRFPYERIRPLLVELKGVQGIIPPDHFLVFGDNATATEDSGHLGLINRGNLIYRK